MVTAISHTTMFLLPTNLSFCLASRATQGEFITHTYTPVQPLPQFHANRFTDQNVDDMSAKKMSQDECLLHLFCLSSLSKRFVPVFPQTVFVPLFPKIFCLCSPFPQLKLAMFPCSPIPLGDPRRSYVQITPRSKIFL